MKSKGIAYLLWFISVCGIFGFHRFYLEKIGTGILWLFTGGLLGFGAFFDLFTLGGQVDTYNLMHGFMGGRGNSNVNVVINTAPQASEAPAQPENKPAVK